jgi:hypothetical protein
MLAPPWQKIGQSGANTPLWLEFLLYQIGTETIWPFRPLA